MRHLRTASAVKLAVIVSFVIGAHSRAATLTDETLQAWNRHVQRSETELLQASADPARFFWTARHSRELEPAAFQPGLSVYSPHGSGIPVPSGLVHHWIGTVFIPNASVADLLGVLQDYDNYSHIYKPAVVESKLVSHTGDRFTYQLKFVQKGFGVKAGLLGEFQSTYHSLTPDSGYSITESTKLTELADPGTPDERPVSFSEAHGYVERVFTIVRYRQVSGGVNVEVEALTLSRGVPAAVRWMIAPLIERFSHRTMAETLERLKGGVVTTATQEAAAGDSTTVAANAPAQ